jgi:F-type H+-transporting ATPase subunit gamma
VASVQDLKRRIRSIRNTRKITKAMELVASARLRRAQARIEAMRPYADRMMELMVGTARASTSVRGLPLLQRRDEVRSAAILPLTGDRGLAGAFNAQVLRHALALDRQLRAEGTRVRWLVSGRKGASTLRFRRFDVIQAWTGFSDRPTYTDAQAIAHRVSELYVDGALDRVVIVYNHFVSPLVQQVVEQQAALVGDFIYEPEPEQILERLLPVYVETELYRALLESAASEQGARMTAMRNASKNAGELIDSLTLAMNRARQAEITQEILEVVAGADALTA